MKNIRFEVGKKVYIGYYAKNTMACMTISMINTIGSIMAPNTGVNPWDLKLLVQRVLISRSNCLHLQVN